MFLKVHAKKKELLVPQHDMAILTWGFSLRCLLLAISANLVKVFKCFMKLNRWLCSSLLSGTLNFSLWIAKVLVPELEVSSVAMR